MLCYKDMTFCPYSQCKEFKTCKRALTQEIKDRALKFGLPICQFAEKPECFKGGS